MPQITIIPAHGSIGIDGVFHAIDLSQVDSSIHAVQFNTDTGVGHVEYKDLSIPQDQLDQTSFDTRFGELILAWNAAQYAKDNPPPPTAEELTAQQVEYIKAQLNDIDFRKSRAITDALLFGDTTRLTTLESAAAALRAELAAL